jgi:hypothetical protein
MVAINLQQASACTVCTGFTLAWLAAGACSMDIPEIQEKYSQFAQKQLMMRAAHAAKERMDMAQAGTTAAAQQLHLQQQ